MMAYVIHDIPIRQIGMILVETPAVWLPFLLFTLGIFMLFWIGNGKGCVLPLLSLIVAFSGFWWGGYTIDPFLHEYAVSLTKKEIQEGEYEIVDYRTIEEATGYRVSFTKDDLTYLGLVSVLYLSVLLLGRICIGKLLALIRISKNVAEDDIRDLSEGTTENVMPELFAGLIGKSGTTITPLQPFGSALIDGQRVPAAARGEFIEDGTAIEAIAVENNRVIVRRFVQSAEES